MRKILLGAAAALAIGAPGVALADSGEVGVHIGNLDFDAGGDADTWGIDGAYAHDLDNGWTLQVAGQHDSLDFGTELGASYGSVTLGMRNDTYSFYGWAGLSDTFAVSNTSIGIGGQYFMNQFVLGGSVGYADNDAFSTTNVHIDGTYYFMDDFGMGVELGSANYDASGPDAEADYWGVNGSYRFTGTAWSINGGYRQYDTDFGGDITGWQLGLRYNFGTGSEHERATGGPSFDGSLQQFRDVEIAF